MSREHAILDPQLTYEKERPEREDDAHAFHPLRPKTLADYIGQDRIKEKLGIYMDAAKSRREALDHCLFYGPPGLGKTSLAHIVAHEMGGKLHATAGPVVERAGDLAALLTNLEPFDVLFIDEIHRLNPIVEEILYPAMEERVLDIMIGQGPSARSIKIDLPPFTLVGATTKAGSLTSPLRDRFGICERLHFYTAEELRKILTRSAKLLDTVIDIDGAREIASRSRGTPRIVNRLLRRIRDYAQVRGNGAISCSVAEEGLRLLDIDHMGFDPMDRKILSTIIDGFGGGPVGIETLSASLAEDKDTLEDVYEPFLLQEGFIQRTPRGRLCTLKAYHHLGIKPPAALAKASDLPDQIALGFEDMEELR